MNKITFRTKIILVFIAIAILQGGIMGFLAYSHATNLIFNNKKNEMINMADKININVSDKVNYLTQLAQSTATSQIVRNNIHEGADILQIGQSKRSISQYFSALALSFEPLCNIMIIDKSNILYSPYDYYRINNFDMPASKYYAIASKNIGRAVWLGMQNNLMFEMEGNAGPKQVLTMVEPITDFYNEKVIAILIMDLNPETFQTVLSNKNDSFPNQTTFMLDQNKKLIWKDSKIEDKLISDMCMRVEELNDGCQELELNGQRSLVSIKTNDQTGWKICSVVPIKDISLQVQSLNHSIIKTVVFCTLLISIFLFLVSYALTAPIKKLILAMKEVWQGNFECRIANRRKDEMGRLIDTFTFMVNKIQTLIREVYEEKLAQKNAELKALQSQINPHFLYNTLDTINWMLLEQKEFEISRIVVSLGNMMKYAINSDGKMATIRQEIEHVSNYLLIQKERMEERLEYEIRIPPELENIKMPRLLLQPLVENAIIHGIEPSLKCGQVVIRAWEKENGYVMEVADNGIGMDRKRVEKLKQNETETGQERTSIGIDNVNRRLKLYYGEASEIKIQSTIGIGTKIQFEIPKEIEA